MNSANTYDGTDILSDESALLSKRGFFFSLNRKNLRGLEDGHSVGKSYLTCKLRTFSRDGTGRLYNLLESPDLPEAFLASQQRLLHVETGILQRGPLCQSRVSFHKACHSSNSDERVATPTVTVCPNACADLTDECVIPNCRCGTSYNTRACVYHIPGTVSALPLWWAFSDARYGTAAFAHSSGVG